MDDDGRRRGARERLALQSQTGSQTGFKRSASWVLTGVSLGLSLGFPTTAFPASMQAASPTLNHVDTLLFLKCLRPSSCQATSSPNSQVSPNSVQAHCRRHPAQHRPHRPPRRRCWSLLEQASSGPTRRASACGSKVAANGCVLSSCSCCHWTLWSKLTQLAPVLADFAVRPSSSRVGRRDHRRPTWRRLQGRHRRIAHGFA